MILVFQSVFNALSNAAVDLTQLPFETRSGLGRESSRQLEDLFDSEEDGPEGAEDPAYADFMMSQSQLLPMAPIDISGPPESGEAPFVRSDEDLSDLDCFLSIDQLLAKGGDEKRRVEFILKQFKKNSGDSTSDFIPKASSALSQKRAQRPPGIRSLGVQRRNDRL